MSRNRGSARRLALRKALTSPAGQAIPPQPGPASTLSLTSRTPGTAREVSAFSSVVRSRGGAMCSKLGRATWESVEEMEDVDPERSLVIVVVVMFVVSDGEKRKGRTELVINHDDHSLPSTVSALGRPLSPGRPRTACSPTFLGCSGSRGTIYEDK